MAGPCGPDLPHSLPAALGSTPPATRRHLAAPAAGRVRAAPCCSASQFGVAAARGRGPWGSAGPGRDCWRVGSPAADHTTGVGLNFERQQTPPDRVAGSLVERHAAATDQFATDSDPRRSAHWRRSNSIGTGQPGRGDRGSPGCVRTPRSAKNSCCPGDRRQG